MAFSEKITLIVDVVTGNAKSGLSGIKSQMAQTEGSFNKLKVAGKGAFDTIGVMGPQIALAAGAALVGFGAKAVKSFQDTALAADKFRDATGAGIEESSRWIAVADDVGVSAGTIQSAFVKMEKAIATNREAFGDLVVTAKDGSVDLSATFLNVITHLQSIQDPIERANESAKLFGRGFAEVSQIITTDAGKIKKSFQEVSDEQLVDEGEVVKARNLEAALDTLGDSIADISRGVGETLVPAVTDAVEGLNELVIAGRGIGEMAAQADTSTGGWLGNMLSLAERNLNPIKIIGTHVKTLNDYFSSDAPAKFGAGLDTFEQRAAGISGVLGANAIDTSGLEEVEAAAEEAGEAIDQTKAAYQLMKDTLTVEEGALNLDEAFADVEQAAADAWTAVSTGAEDADEKVRNHQSEVNSLKQRVLEYGEQVLGLPAEKATEILALIDQGKLREADAALDKAAKTRQAAIDAKTRYVPAAEAAFERAARTRVAVMTAKPNTGSAEGALNSTARNRQSTITAQANTGDAESKLAFAARSRQASINVGVTGAGGLLFRQEGGPIPGSKNQAVPIVAHGGEYVLDAGTVDAIKRGKESAGNNGGGSGVATVGAGSGQSITVNFTGPVIGSDQASIGRWVMEAIAVAQRRGFRVA